MIPTASYMIALHPTPSGLSGDSPRAFASRPDENAVCSFRLGGFPSSARALRIPGVFVSRKIPVCRASIQPRLLRYD
ncbi:MAG: hypothetical protein GX897_03860 [Clostridiales bacterium]|nr:hypothetical protein [Clostridiales bacterium]